MIMLILDSHSSNPRFNIASEEYLLKTTKKDYAFFYINQPSIIIGKHQNAWAEINLSWTRQNNIPVVRRLSGGGTVWHDPGNLNFSFILNGEEGKLVNFREYASPVLNFLQELGVPAEFGKRNEMLVDGLKISGNAEHIHRKRVLHHGTLLFSSNLSKLKLALETNPDMYKDKAVQSIRSEVGNIRDFLKESMEISDFRRQLLSHILKVFTGSKTYTLSDAETEGIRKLIKEKYSLWSWNIGYSPRYSLQRKIEMGDTQCIAKLEVEKGLITHCILSGDVPGLDVLAENLSGAEHDPESLKALISTNM
ncbi:lipoate--protein ligase, partial [Bacteroidota bacterium]